MSRNQTKKPRRIQVPAAPSPTELLLSRLEQWLLQQPEWPAIMLAPRQLRKAFGRQVANRVVTIPKRLTPEGTLREFVHREAVAELLRNDGPGGDVEVLLGTEGDGGNAGDDSTTDIASPKDERGPERDDVADNGGLGEPENTGSETGAQVEAQV